MIPLLAKAHGLLFGVALAVAGYAMDTGTLTMQSVVNSGHRGAVLDMAADSRRGLVFSVGEDGTLRVWDEVLQTLVHRIAVTRQRAQSVALNPASQLAAILVTDGVRSFSINVWDWGKGMFLYKIPLDSEPLSIRFSLTGTYLICGEMTRDSLHVYLSQDGTPVPLHIGDGMVGFAEISRSDATLMTYRPTGTIEYVDIASGMIIRQVETAGNLVDVKTSDDRRFLVGHAGEEIVCVDALTGETRYRISAPGLLTMDASGDAGKVSWITHEGAVQLWSAVDGSLTSLPSVAQLGWRPHIVRFTRDNILLAGGHGQISKMSPAGQQTEVARDILATTSGFAARAGMLALAAGATIHVFHVGSDISELFSIPAPYVGPVGLAFLDDQRLLVWRQADEPGVLGLIDLARRSFADVQVTFKSSLAAVRVREGLIYALEKGGRVVVVEAATGRHVFETSWPGAVCIAPVGPTAIVVGQVKDGGLQSSLVRIDLRTGETSSLPGSGSFTFALVPDPADGSLYSLGVDADGSTKLYHNVGLDLENASIVDSSAGEYLSASLSLDPSSGILYSSLGRKSVTAWTGGTLSRLGDASRGIQSLIAREGVVSALQRDSTVSLWDAASDRAIGTIFPFSDGTWAAIMADGSIAGVPAGMAKVEVFVQGKLVESGGSTRSAPSQELPAAP